MNQMTLINFWLEKNEIAITMKGGNESQSWSRMEVKCECGAESDFVVNVAERVCRKMVKS